MKNIALLVTIVLICGCVSNKRKAAGDKNPTMRISLTSIFVDDPVKAHEFYTKTLGFQTKEFMPEGQLAIVVSAEDPGGTALLLEPRGDSFGKTYQESVYSAGLPIIVFGTDDVATTRNALEAKGVKFRDDLAKPEWGMQNIFEDTFGNLVMLHHHGGAKQDE